MSKYRSKPTQRPYPQENDTRQPVREVRPEIEKIASEAAHSLLAQCEPHELAHALGAFKLAAQKVVAKLADNGTYLSDAAKAAEEALG